MFGPSLEVGVELFLESLPSELEDVEIIEAEYGRIVNGIKILRKAASAACASEEEGEFIELRDYEEELYWLNKFGLVVESNSTPFVQAWGRTVLV